MSHDYFRPNNSCFCVAAYRTSHPNRVDCDYTNPPPPGKSCNFNLEKFGPCVSENHYGILQGSPCFFLKLNADRSWTPKSYNSSDLPKEMPSELKEAVKVFNQKALWVSCDGEDEVDKEHIGPILYIPDRAFYNYEVSPENDGYVAPLIAVQIQKPTRETFTKSIVFDFLMRILFLGGVVFKVKCTMWIPNASESVSLTLQVE